MNKKKKIIYGLGSAGILVAPMVSLISCGSTSDDYKDKVLFKYTWAANGKQIKALKKVVDYYNAKVRKNGDFEVLLKHVEGGYGDAVKKDIQDIKNDHMGPVASLVIDYPDSVGSLRGYGLNFALKEDGNSNAVDFKDYFESKFTSAKIPGSKATDLFQIPLAKSSDALTISIPVFAKFVKDGVLGFDRSLSNDFVTNIKAKITNYNAQADNDIANVNKLWGVKNSGAKLMNIDDNTFSTFDKIKSLGKHIKDSYSKVSNIKSNGIHVFGIDAPANTLYQIYSSKTNFNNGKFLWNIDNNGKAKYPGIKDKKSDEYTQLKNSLQYMIELVRESGILINGGGAYSSTDFKNEKIALVMGSTAGYSHNFSSSSKASKGIEFTGQSGKVQKKLENHEKMFVLPNNENKTKGAIAQTSDDYKNPVYPSTFSGTAGKHDIKLINAKADKVVSDGLKNGAVAYVNKNGKIAKAAGTNAIDAKGGKHPMMVLTGKIVSMPAANESDKIGEDEISITIPPQKVSIGDSKNWILSQGPSIIGIRHGSKDKLDNKKDKEAIKFVRWFFNPESTMEITTNGTKSNINPVKYFETNAGYITPLKGAFKVGNRTNWTENPGLLTAFDAFKKANDANGIAFDNPITPYSGSIRKQFVSSLKVIYQTHKKSESSPISINDTLDALIKKLDSIVR